MISALGDERKRGSAHVPYRDSKLTRLLQVRGCTLRMGFSFVKTELAALYLYASALHAELCWLASSLSWDPDSVPTLRAAELHSIQHKPALCRESAQSVMCVHAIEWTCPSIHHMC